MVDVNPSSPPPRACHQVDSLISLPNFPVKINNLIFERDRAWFILDLGVGTLAELRKRVGRDVIILASDPV